MHSEDWGFDGQVNVFRSPITLARVELPQGGFGVVCTVLSDFDSLRSTDIRFFTVGGRSEDLDRAPNSTDANLAVSSAECDDEGDCALTYPDGGERAA